MATVWSVVRDWPDNSPDGVRMPALTLTGCCAPPGTGRGTPFEGFQHAADLRACSPRPARSTRLCHRPAAARLPRPMWLATTQRQRVTVRHRIGPGEEGTRRLHRVRFRYPLPEAASAAGGQHPCAAGRVHRGKRRHQVSIPGTTIGSRGGRHWSGRPAGRPGRHVTPAQPCSTGQPLARRRCRTREPASAARRDSSSTARRLAAPP